LPKATWDLVIIANVIRLEPEDRVRALLHRATAALRPGGSLLIVDAFASGSPLADQARAIYALHLAMRTREGHVHSPADVCRWMEDAGCESAADIHFDHRHMAPGALQALLARKR
jgi:hypothetical protein